MATNAGDGRAFYVREFSPARDYARLQGWWSARGMTAPPANALPRLGVVATRTPGGESFGAAFLFMDNSVNVAMIEWLCTKPGMLRRESLGAWRALVEFLEISAREMGYIIVRAITYPALARLAEKNGWRVMQAGLCSVIKEVPARG